MPTDIKLKYLPLIEEKLPSFPWYVGKFVEYKLNHNFSPLTLFNYLNDYEFFFNWLIADGFYTGKRQDIPLEVLEKLYVDDIDSYFSHLRTQYLKKDYRNQRMSENTLDRRISSLKSLFHYLSQIAEDENYYPLLKRNVMAKYKMRSKKKDESVRVQSIKSKILKNKEEIDAFRDFVAHGYEQVVKDNKRIMNYYLINKERDTAIISLFLGSGIRVSELVGLNVDDIVLKENEISIIRKRGIEAVVSISDVAKADLKEYLKVRNKKYIVDDKERALFLSYPTGKQKKSGRMSVISVQTMVKKYAKAFGKNKLSVHKLRHSFAKHLMEKTNNLLTVKEALGHEDVNTTTIYTKIEYDEVKQAVIQADNT